MNQLISVLISFAFFSLVMHPAMAKEVDDPMQVHARISMKFVTAGYERFILDRTDFNDRRRSYHFYPDFAQLHITKKQQDIFMHLGGVYMGRHDDQYLTGSQQTHFLIDEAYLKYEHEHFFARAGEGYTLFGSGSHMAEIDRYPLVKSQIQLLSQARGRVLELGCQYPLFQAALYAQDALSTDSQDGSRKAYGLKLGASFLTHWQKSSRWDFNFSFISDPGAIELLSNLGVQTTSNSRNYASNVRFRAGRVDLQFAHVRLKLRDDQHPNVWDLSLLYLLDPIEQGAFSGLTYHYGRARDTHSLLSLPQSFWGIGAVQVLSKSLSLEVQYDINKAYSNNAGLTPVDRKFAIRVVYLV